MTKGTMLLKEHDDGSLEISYEDYDVEIFGGGDYEAIYNIDTENAEKLRRYLMKSHSGSMEEMLVDEFGIHMDKRSFASTCDENGIQYELFTWIS